MSWSAIIIYGPNIIEETPTGSTGEVGTTAGQQTEDETATGIPPMARAAVGVPRGGADAA